MLTNANNYSIIVAGDAMNTDFNITKIHTAIFVNKYDHPNARLNFPGNLKYNELIYHISGEATVHFNGKTLETKKNTIRFLPKGENKGYVVEKKEFGECIDIFFDTDLPVSDEAFTIDMAENTTVGNLFNKFFTTWISKNDGYRFECLSILYKIFAQMQSKNYIPQNQYDKIKPAITYIEENFLKEKISIASLAEKCKISETYLKKLFIKKLSMPPSKYIIQMKINFATELLRSGLYSITQIADMCGYETPYFFSRQFKEYVGLSPTDFAEKFKVSK